VSKLAPTLDWAGGLLGIRLRLEPVDAQLLYKEFLDAIAATETMKAAVAGAKNHAGGETKLTLWPANLMDYLARRLDQHFRLRAYPDPDQLVEPESSRARPQALPDDSVPLDGDPLSGLIRVDEINAPPLSNQSGLK
jgi:hypothetical protein